MSDDCCGRVKRGYLASGFHAQCIFQADITAHVKLLCRPDQISFSSSEPSVKFGIYTSDKLSDAKSKSRSLKDCGLKGAHAYHMVCRNFVVVVVFVIPYLFLVVCSKIGN